MFLAIKEILFSKSRYILIILVIMLTTYLTIFLSGLAYGLASDNRSSVDAWDADGIILNKNANDSITMSYLNEEQYKSVDAKQSALLSVSASIISLDGDEESETLNTYIFGIEEKGFIMPEVSEGEVFAASNEAVVDSSLNTKYGYEIGDKIELSSFDTKLTIVGFSEDKKFNTAPVIYVSLDDYRSFVNMPSQTMSNTMVNGIVYKGTVDIQDSSLDKLTINQFIDEIPGYRPQVLTFSLMIGFLIGIVAFVLGIFIYVLTVQKTAMFGIMKAQGISNKIIRRSVIAQTLALTFIGTATGSLLTFVTSLFLPESVPFQFSGLLFGAILLSMFVFSLIGALFSVRSATKVDPLIAMGV
ncbi:ABC transporter permease [Breznakia pachnodae]|uniref:Putative hemin transport system permease protein HrtB n=1 Tax=Breznakia pachnodae TaxID=265178 RepID=A0ABU0DYC3_9FIRM|nr:ABC transporter permease [Breznakia pachnodae]MDQ0359498.1 putative ABC transport system permease protein [Breznakia pachnodae]